MAGWAAVSRLDVALERGGLTHGRQGTDGRRVAGHLVVAVADVGVPVHRTGDAGVGGHVGLHLVDVCGLGTRWNVVAAPLGQERRHPAMGGREADYRAKRVGRGLLLALAATAAAEAVVAVGGDDI